MSNDSILLYLTSRLYLLCPHWNVGLNVGVSLTHPLSCFVGQLFTNMAPYTVYVSHKVIYVPSQKPSRKAYICRYHLLPSSIEAGSSNARQYTFPEGKRMASGKATALLYGFFKETYITLCVLQIHIGCHNRKSQNNKAAQGMRYRYTHIQSYYNRHVKIQV